MTPDFKYSVLTVVVVVEKDLIELGEIYWRGGQLKFVKQHETDSKNRQRERERG
jgi:hypothetical protein